MKFSSKFLRPFVQPFASSEPIEGVDNTYIPIETSPDWETVGGSNPTYVNMIDGVLTQVGDVNPEQAIAYRAYNAADVEVSCIVHHENPSNDIKSFFLAARMSSVDDAIALRGYNGVIELYDRVDGAFQSLLVATPSNSGTIGTRITLRVVGTQVSAIVGGVEYIAETPTTLLSAGRVGFLGRASVLGDTPLASSYRVSLLSRDLDGDNLPDTVIYGGHGIAITEDSNSVNIDTDGDGIADIIIPK